MKYKAIIFDFDGTLPDSLKELGDSMNAVLESLNLRVHSPDSYKYFVGDGFLTSSSA